MKRKLAPLLIIATLYTPAGAAELPRNGEAELVTYATIQDFLTVDGGSAGAFGAGKYSGVGCTA